MLGAIIVADRTEATESTRSQSGLSDGWWASVEVLGKSAIVRLAEYLKAAGCDSVSMIDSDSDRLARLKESGVENILIARCGAYVEIDAPEMLSFHRQQGMGVTRAVTNEGTLDVWIVDSHILSEHEPTLPALQGKKPAYYHSRGYANPLKTARDFRRLVLDSFNSRCRLRPLGSEIRPGVWVSEGAQIERTARIVAPSFVGRNARVSAECLITRGSNIESNSHIDFGTAVEDSSILTDSYVGIGLDLSHSIVDGRNLLNLRHNVNLEITDPVVMRPNAVRGGSHQPLAQRESGEFALSSAD